jgi:iron complex outermembrane receptor protein
MVPGMQVARIDSNKWAISARGFNGQYANKLLVLIDGRTVYTQVFSGVHWDIQDTLIEDVERIEVIRGPGGTLWGAFANPQILLRRQKFFPGPPGERDGHCRKQRRS